MVQKRGIAGRTAGVRFGWYVASALALAAVCCSSASASVKTADVTADRVALGAFKQYLGTVHSQASDARDAADAYVASISTGCPNVLGPLTSQSSVNATAVEAFGEEAGLDMALAATVPYHAPLSTFANKVSRLRWSSPRSRPIVKRYFAAEHAALFMSASDLCGDASALVASNGQSTPAGTTQALAAFSKASKREKQASSAMSGLLSRFATRADKRVVKAINKLGDEVDSDAKALVVSEVPKLLAVLGASS